jgi:hydroxymethylglutaryl-CoA lyase
MSDIPKYVYIQEEGPREGFQIEPGPIPTADKIRLIEALAETGLKHIQACSFVSPKVVPGWADAEATVTGFKAKPGVNYTALWFNENGLKRAGIPRQADHFQYDHWLPLMPSRKRTCTAPHSENLAAMRKQTYAHLADGVTVGRDGVMAAFGSCNYQGAILRPAQVINTLEDGFATRRR